MTREATRPLLVPALRVDDHVRREGAPVALSTRNLFEAHAAFVLRLVQRMGVSASDAEDVAQEVFVIVHRRIGELRKHDSARSWLFGIARRVVANHLRKLRRRSAPGTSERDPSPNAADPAEQLDAARDRARLDRALERLDEDKRNVFVLFELEGLEMREVAQIVGCPVNTAYSRLYAARELVQRYVLGAKSEGVR
jgi:RNA polymerase sigma-70 factor (ECF subfamily)